MSTPTLPPNLPPVEFFQLTLRHKHLEQLRELELPIIPIRNSTWPVKSDTPSPYDLLVEWSATAKEQIAKAVANRELHLCSHHVADHCWHWLLEVISPWLICTWLIIIKGANLRFSDQIDWNNEVLTLLESAAVDLRQIVRYKAQTISFLTAWYRNNEKVAEAVRLARKRTREADELALQLLEESQEQIKEIVSPEFIVIWRLHDARTKGRPMGSQFWGRLRYVKASKTKIWYDNWYISQIL